MRYWSTSYLLGYLMAQTLIMRAVPNPLTFIAIVIRITILRVRMFLGILN